MDSAKISTNFNEYIFKKTSKKVSLDKTRKGERKIKNEKDDGVKVDNIVQIKTSFDDATPPRLTNLGNTCYINSLLQLLFATPIFNKYINDL